jgi:hypothetical protein
VAVLGFELGRCHVIGLVAIAVVVGWAALVVGVFGAITRALDASSTTRRVVHFSLSAIVIVLPIADELVGGVQFRHLCREKASTFELGVPNPAGRVTKALVSSPEPLVPAMWLPIQHWRVEYRDSSTEELVVASNVYQVQPGLLMRTIGLPIEPLFAGSSACRPERGVSASIQYKFTVIQGDKR